MVIQVAALGEELYKICVENDTLCGMPVYPVKPAFPAVTCTAQAALRTGLESAGHGIVANGWFWPAESKVEFWNQSAHLLPERRIWNLFRQHGGSVGTLFFQQSIGDSSVDINLSPAPIHKHSGGIIQDCYSKPADLYRKLCQKLGRPFNLLRYWGPFSSIKATRWIAEATAAVITTPEWSPDLLFTYLPHMDYILQKKGPNAFDSVQKNLNELLPIIGFLVDTAREAGYKILICSDYAMHTVDQALFPNRILLESGLLRTRIVKGKSYPDLYASDAVAICDHQVAHIYLRDTKLVKKVRRIFQNYHGIDAILPHDSMAHSNAGDLILVAEANAWFAYPWWTDDKAAPDYAGRVDIHSKIGFDPCELFLDRWIPPKISQNTNLVRGSHGRDDIPAFFATDMQWSEQPDSYLQMVNCLERQLESL